ncbi:hypothetical protein V8F33_011453 [Rhypophila sp. PSN 637]
MQPTKTTPFSFHQPSQPFPASQRFQFTTLTGLMRMTFDMSLCLRMCLDDKQPPETRYNMRQKGGGETKVKGERARRDRRTLVLLASALVLVTESPTAHQGRFLEDFQKDEKYSCTIEMQSSTKTRKRGKHKDGFRALGLTSLAWSPRVPWRIVLSHRPDSLGKGRLFGLDWIVQLDSHPSPVTSKARNGGKGQNRDLLSGHEGRVKTMLWLQRSSYLHVAIEVLGKRGETYDRPAQETDRPDERGANACLGVLCNAIVRMYDGPVHPPR